MTGVGVGAGTGVAVGGEVGTGVAVTVGVGVGVAGEYAIASQSPLPSSVYAFPLTTPSVSMLVKFPAVTAGAVHAVLPVELGSGVGVGAVEPWGVGVGVTGADDGFGVGVAVAGLDDPTDVGAALVLRTGASDTEPLLHPAASAAATRATNQNPPTRTPMTQPPRR